MPRPSDGALLFLDLQEDILPTGRTQPVDRLRIASAASATASISVAPFGNPEPMPIDEFGSETRGHGVGAFQAQLS